MAEKFCSNCGTFNRISAQFCIQCGESFPKLHAQNKFCPQCGVRRKPDTKFCTQCGHQWPVPAPIAPQPPIQQPAPVGIVLPPVAEIPLLDEEDSLAETQIDPTSALPPDSSDALVRRGGQTGVILTDDELARLRKQPDRPLFIYTPKSPKRR
jgi:hypothetical protein